MKSNEGSSCRAIMRCDMAQSATNKVKRQNWLVVTLQTWILLQTTKKECHCQKTLQISGNLLLDTNNIFPVLLTSRIF